MNARQSIRIVADAHALSAFVPALAERLARRPGSSVTVEISSTGAMRDTALETLLTLERMVLRRGRSCWSDLIGEDRLNALLGIPSTAEPDIVIDLTEAGVEHATAKVLRPLYDGAPGESALASALFFNGTPQISILSSSPGEEVVVVANGVASLEAASGIGGAMEAVWSRVLMLIEKALASPRETGQAPTRAVHPLTRSDVVRRSSKMTAMAAARAAYRLCCHAPHWRVGWRHTTEAQDVWSRRDLGGKAWNILADPGDHFYADPFPFRHGGRDHLFFEDLDHKTNKGIISVVVFDEDGVPGPVVPVIEEPWHLSYPFLIEADGEIWMIPEASLSGEVSIYRAVDFPHRWQRHGALLSGLEAADATVVQHEGRFYMFAVVRDGVGGYSDALSIWHADGLFDPWLPHAGNPVMVDDRSARPAGNFVIQNGALMRPVQDCRHGYGAALNLARIDHLDPEHFEQSIETHLAPGVAAWPGRRLHTLNRAGTLEAIDGSIIRPKLGLAASVVDRANRPI
ncbi:hypothetical protein [Mesorhizobium sp. CAU 1741]|uniref:glucosamine inositolphosphorylceramide transferase family protein n=1 Tax=Mesorhizobium sp. CAU 1741 TaxID=3140366 RepID=UPI00325B4447